ncbi:MAG: hypothetical protein GY697_23360 [Desulfobacterales bacterium]|nr:hypothetical protein [Desulfobacterales bacterium]
MGKSGNMGFIRPILSNHRRHPGRGNRPFNNRVFQQNLPEADTGKFHTSCNLRPETKTIGLEISITMTFGVCAYDTHMDIDHMECSSQVEIHRRRKPQETSLWKLLNGHFVDFEESYDKLFQKKYVFYRPVIPHVVRKYLEGGDLHQGLDVSQVRFIG